MKGFERCVIIISLLLGISLLSGYASAPPLREQMSLNGYWATGGTVPVYEGISNLTTKTYERSVTVPSSWTNKIIRLEFNAVNFIAEVYINNVLKTTHVGGWNPFNLDITNLVTPGNPFTLKVVVKGPNNSPIIDGNGKYQWPVGGWSARGGIADDVWLRAYGKVYIEDAFIKPSVRNKRLIVDYTIVNKEATSQTINLDAIIHPEKDSSQSQTIPSVSVTIPANSSLVKTVIYNWSNPNLWWPDDPKLYHLDSRIKNGSNVIIDKEARRFGFREIWVVKNLYCLNGVRVNLFGDYQSYGDTWYNTAQYHSPSAWPGAVDKMKALNMRVIRWHHNPGPQYILDVCDEKGLMVCDEAANYAREYLVGTNHTAYVTNFKTWCAPWIKQDRNHPCVYLWNATNEMTYASLGGYTNSECYSMGNEIAKYDTTRNVGYDGDLDVGGQAKTYNYHYPEGYNYEPSGNLYGWASKVKSTKPTGSGELLHSISGDASVQTQVERNKWWLGIWLRGLRYTNWTDVRPACFWFTQADLASTNPKVQMRTINLKNCFAPVALFDRAYDSLGIAPFVTGTTAGGTLPSLTNGANLTRRLILYNDEFKDTIVQTEIIVKSGTTTYATGTNTFNVTLGYHKDLYYQFQVPNISGQTLDIVLRTYKNGVKKFEEIRQFKVTGTGSGATSNTVKIYSNSSDTQSPTAPSNLQSPSKTETTVSLTWNASTDNVGVTSYDIYKDGSLMGNSTSTSYTASGLTQNTSYSFTLKAKDAAGNVSAASTALVVKTNISSDTQAPTAPSNLQSPSKTETTVNLTWNASTDNVGVTSYDIYKDGSLMGNSTSTSYTANGLTQNTSYSFTVKAKDAVGNVSAASTALVVKTNASTDTQAPTAPGNLTSSSVTSQSVLLTWNASTDNVAVSQYQIFQNGSLIGTSTGTSYSVTGLTGKTTYTFTVKAKDAAGNTSSASNTVNVTTLTAPDTQAPTAPGKPVASNITNNSLTLTWSASTDNTGVSSYLIYKNGTLTGTTSSTSFNITNLEANTSYNFTIKAKDAAGNISNQSTPVIANTASLDLSSKEKTSVLVFPNPFADKITIHCEENSSLKQIRIMDESGREIMNDMMTSGDLEMTTRDLPQGLYIIEIWNAFEKYESKIIKQ